ncbi:related to gef1 protein [Lichtheimia corymbifera JMRC:FSU:9682]|uniref:Related to gef1 protein n=1 Tax=Lichtheimia corymbifera JMRC:FSU:9682 TaxID=1263082 RepID=A0A068RGG8_9FUNG|nr:related to gef1 protein [Lichtheimia corymbifera JMRC:FSU:9682]
MLSASTLSSNASDAFSTTTSTTTPASPYPPTQNASGHNPLTELIETEKNYMDTLKIIDTQLAPLWSAQQAPDFNDLLNNVRDILRANKRFCGKLTKIAANPQTIKELGDVLMQWVDDMEVPYANFSRGFIANLNQRQDIVDNPAIRKLLQDLSMKANYEITLESLFNAPVQQLKYYKMLYGRLLESAEPGRADHKLLLKANQRIDTVMLMAQKSSAKSASSSDHVSSARLHSKALPVVTPIQTDMSRMSSSELVSFQNNLDCSKVVDVFTGAPTQCTPKFATNDTSILARNNFVLLAEETHLESSTRVDVVLTNEFLIITRENTDAASNSHILVYPPLAVSDIIVKSKMVDRELVGEYLLEVAIQDKKRLTLRADTKETRNRWVGANDDAPSSSTLAPQPLSVVVQKHGGKPAASSSSASVVTKGSNREPRKSVIRKQDFFSFYTDQSGEISPLSSDDSDTEDAPASFQSKIPAVPPKMNDEKNLPAPPPPPKTASSSQATPQQKVNNTGPKPPIKTDKGLLATPPPQQDASRLSPTRVASPAPSVTSISTHGSEDSSGAGSPIRPVSPRTVEISHAVAPVAMQAITQNNDYLSTPNSHTTKPLPRTSSSPNDQKPSAPAPVRSSSFRQQPPQQQQPQPMRSQPQPNNNPAAKKALPQGPVASYATPPPPQHHHQHHQAAPPPPSPGYYAPRPHQPPPPPMGRPAPLPASANMPSSRSPSPGLPPTPGYTNDPSRPPPPPPGHHLHTPPHLRPQRSMDELNSPPRSPTPHMVNGQTHGIRQVVFSNKHCQVFHWKAESWYGVEGQCVVEVRQTYTNRSCVAIQLQQTGQLYLNAWVLPSTVICHASPTDVSISVYMGGQKENYLIHFHSPADAVAMYQILQRMHQEALKNDNGSIRASVVPPSNLIRSMSIDDEPAPKEDNTTVPQSLRLVMQCKTKLFVQNEHSKWSSFGSVQMKISQQLPSKRMHIEIENKSTKLVSALVLSRNVERISPKRITILLVNEKERQRMVYMVQIKEEETGNKMFEYLKTKNAENGW